MALRRFYFPREQIENSPEFRISGELFHHLIEVCRFSVGDQFELLSGDGQAHLVKIVMVGKKDCAVVKLSERSLPQPEKPLIVLALSVPKLPKVDWIVEKCVELGVHKIVPFVSDYSFLRKVNEISPSRTSRWQKIVQAATQQSGRGDLMAIENPQTLPELLKEFNQHDDWAGLFPYEGDSEQGLKAALNEVKSKPYEQVWAFVGSEGGFSLEEVKLFAQFGLEPVTLGGQILRVETACLALVSILKYELGV